VAEAAVLRVAEAAVAEAPAAAEQVGEADSVAEAEQEASASICACSSLAWRPEAARARSPSR
jgi:hypothetical protein